MVKKLKRLLTILFAITMISSLFFPYSVSATTDMMKGADSFIQDGTQSTPIGDDNVKNLSDIIFNVLLVIGTALAVIIGMILGIQFITGSVEQKSKVKETLVPYIVGCFVIFGAFGIWKLVVSILQNL